jgi:hypothetical protein
VIDWLSGASRRHFEDFPRWERFRGSQAPRAGTPIFHIAPKHLASSDNRSYCLHALWYRALQIHVNIYLRASVYITRGSTSIYNKPLGGVVRIYVNINLRDQIEHGMLSTLSALLRAAPILFLQKVGVVYRCLGRS